MEHHFPGVSLVMQEGEPEVLTAACQGNRPECALEEVFRDLRDRGVGGGSGEDGEVSGDKTVNKKRCVCFLTSFTDFKDVNATRTFIDTLLKFQRDLFETATVVKDTIQRDGDKDDLEDLFPTTSSDQHEEYSQSSCEPQRLRNLIFRAAMQHSQGDLVHLGQIHEVNSLASRAKPSTLGEGLDLLSHTLFGYTDNERKQALKLTLSHIAYNVPGPGKDQLVQFLQHYPDLCHSFYQGLERKPVLSKGMDTKKKLFFDQVVLESAKGIADAQLLLAAKRLQLRQSGCHPSDDMLLVVVDILDRLMDDFAYSAQPDSKKSELYFYRKFASNVMDIILCASNSQIYEGETTSNSTKRIRAMNYYKA
ncbi:hypothetical protein MBANPS3_003987 [Mucor bainieri]